MGNSHCGQETTARTEYGETDDFLQAKVSARVHFTPYLFNLYAERILLKARLDSDEGGVKIGGRNVSSLRYVDDTILWTESTNHLK